MKLITVREYARLTTKPLEEDTLDRAHISPSAFDWLCELHSKWGKSETSFVDIEGTKTLRLNNYVGMIETPCGTHIEILPKTHEYAQEKEKTRSLLWRMLTIYLGKDTKEADLASIKCMNKPITEWLIRIYLQELAQLLKKGLHSQYNKVNEERTFIRGQINIARQMRQPMHKQHLTHVCHNIFSVDRAENRLLKTALHLCHKSTKDSENWIHATQLIKMMEQVPLSNNVKNDMKQWQKARHMTHYEAIKPWCTLILQSNLPTALYDTWRGISLLFPMEKLFEAFVVDSLRKRLDKGTKLTSQSSRHYLCSYEESGKFLLKPDILLEQGESTWVIDAKWKRLDPSENNFDISQADMYQMFAYGHKYLKSKGNMALVYPATDKFQGLDSAFSYNPDLNLYVFACDLESGELLQVTHASDFPIK